MNPPYISGSSYDAQQASELHLQISPIKISKFCEREQGARFKFKSYLSGSLQLKNEAVQELVLPSLDSSALFASFGNNSYLDMKALSQKQLKEVFLNSSDARSFTREVVHRGELGHSKCSV